MRICKKQERIKYKMFNGSARYNKGYRIRTAQTPEMEHSSPMFLTSSFCFDNAEDMRATFADETDDNIYSRFSNPSVQEFTDRMVALEGAEAGFATASGMSAVFASFMGLLKKGDHLLSCNAIFGSTHTVISKIMPKYGIEHSYVDATDVASWEAAIKPNTKMIYIETPTNPGLEVIDIAFVSALAKKHKIILNVDNCFATPGKSTAYCLRCRPGGALCYQVDRWTGTGIGRRDCW